MKFALCFACIIILQVRAFSIDATKPTEEKPINSKPEDHQSISDEILEIFTKCSFQEIINGMQYAILNQQNDTINNFLDRKINTTFSKTMPFNQTHDIQKRNTNVNPPSGPQNCWNQCVSKLDLDEHAITENHQILLLKQELTKLHQLVRLLQDEQYILNILNEMHNKQQELSTQQSKELEDFLRFLKTYQGKLKETVIEPKSKVEVDQNILSDLQKEVSQLKEVIKNKYLDKLNMTDMDALLKTDLDKQTKAIEEMQELIDKVENASHLFNDTEGKLEPNNIDVQHNLTKLSETQARVAKPHDNILQLSQKNQPHSKTLLALLHPTYPQKHVRVDSQIRGARAEGNEFVEALQRLFGIPTPNLDENSLNHNKLKMKLLDIEQEIKLASTIHKLQKELKNIQDTTDSKEESGSGIQTELKRIKQQIKKLNQDKLQNRELGEDVIEERLKDLQTAIDELKPKESINTQEVNSATNFQIMLNKLLNSPPHLQNVPQHNLTPEQIQQLKRKIILMNRPNTGGEQQVFGTNVFDSQYGSQPNYNEYNSGVIKTNRGKDNQYGHQIQKPGTNIGDPFWAGFGTLGNLPYSENRPHVVKNGFNSNYQNADSFNSRYKPLPATSYTPPSYETKYVHDLPGDRNYALEKVEELKAHFNDLENIINNLNRPEYTLKQDDQVAVQKLEEKLNELKSIINNLNQAPHNYNDENQYQIYRNSQSGIRSHKSPAQKMRIRRDTSKLAAFTETKDNSNKIKYTLPVKLATKRNIHTTDNENSTGTAHTFTKFFQQMYNFFEVYRYLSENLEKHNETNTENGTLFHLIRHVREAPNQNMLDGFLSKIMFLANNVNHVTHELLRNNCSCTEKCRQKREVAKDPETTEAVGAMASFFKNILDEVQAEEASKFGRTEVQRHQEKLKQKLDELKNQLDMKIRLHPGELGNNPYRSSFQQYDYSYPQQDQYSYGFNKKKDKTKELKITDNKFLDKVFGKILDKIVDKVIYSIPRIMQRLFESLLGYGYTNNYEKDNYNDYSVQNNYGSYSLFAYLPMLIIKLSTEMTYFVKILQKNKFVKTFLVPGVITALIPGLVVFLVWWLTTDDKYYSTETYDSTYSSEYDNNDPYNRNAREFRTVPISDLQNIYNFVLDTFSKNKIQEAIHPNSENYLYNKGFDMFKNYFNNRPGSYIINPDSNDINKKSR